MNSQTIFLVLLAELKIAEVFLHDQYKNGFVVNHKNGIKTDNRIINLEWVSVSENNKNAYRIGAKKGYSSLKGVTGYNHYLSMEVLQYSKNGIYIASFGSLREAEKNTKTSHSSISMCAKGIYKKAGGYMWRFGKVKTYPVEVLKEIYQKNL